MPITEHLTANFSNGRCYFEGFSPTLDKESNPQKNSLAYCRYSFLGWLLEQIGQAYCIPCQKEGQSYQCYVYKTEFKKWTDLHPTALTGILDQNQKIDNRVAVQCVKAICKEQAEINQIKQQQQIYLEQKKDFEKEQQRKFEELLIQLNRKREREEIQYAKLPQINLDLFRDKSWERMYWASVIPVPLELQYQEYGPKFVADLQAEPIEKKDNLSFFMRTLYDNDYFTAQERAEHAAILAKFTAFTQEGDQKIEFVGFHRYAADADCGHAYFFKRHIKACLDQGAHFFAFLNKERSKVRFMLSMSVDLFQNFKRQKAGRKEIIQHTIETIKLAVTEFEQHAHHPDACKVYPALLPTADEWSEHLHAHPNTSWIEKFSFWKPKLEA